MTAATWSSVFDTIASSVGYTVTDPVFLKPVDEAARDRLRNNLDIHSALLFYCGDRIAKKIRNILSPDKTNLIDEQPDHYVVYDTDEQRQRTLQKIYCGIDNTHHTQICTTYDIENKDLTFHFGGTDFSRISDVWAAAKSAFGGLNRRAVDGVKLAHASVASFQELHPNVDLKGVNVQIVGHSSGTTTALVAKHVLEQFTRNAVDTVLLDPFGARKTLKVLAQATGQSEDSLSKNVTTVKGQKHVLHHFRKAAASIGDCVTLAMAGHVGKNFVEHYGQERYKRRTADPMT